MRCERSLRARANSDFQEALAPALLEIYDSQNVGFSGVAMARDSVEPFAGIDVSLADDRYQFRRAHSPSNFSPRRWETSSRPQRPLAKLREKWIELL